MQTTSEKIVHPVSNIYGNNTSNKIQNKTRVSIPDPEYTEYVQSKHKQRVELLNL